MHKGICWENLYENYDLDDCEGDGTITLRYIKMALTEMENMWNCLRIVSKGRFSHWQC
jgi:hypothetical protein